MNPFFSFPESGLEQSVMTPVLLGVLLSWFFTETFGWVFAGLVVPGYLASVFVVHPVGGWISLGEIVVTYALARVLGEQLSQTGLTSRVFGRERFFLVVLVSILVRVVIEGVVLPRIVPHAGWAFGIGLVVVPLGANACWKTGLVRGFVQNGVPCLLVYLLLRLVLIPHTNLSLRGFELLTENVVAGFLASPKVYILLLTGAAFAAAANVRYGWDFNGILVPALLCLAWIAPAKLAATFAEALLAYGIGSLVMRYVSVEGPRRLVLFFLVDYVLRFVASAQLGRFVPDGRVQDFLGVGYLLPALLAAKMAQRSSTLTVALPTVTVSLVAFASASCLGFVARQAEQPLLRSVEGDTPPPLPMDVRTATVWLTALLDAFPASADDDRLRWAALARAAVGEGPAAVRQELADGVFVLREPTDRRIGARESRAILQRTRGARYDHQRRVARLEGRSLSPVVAFAAAELLRGGALDAVVLAVTEEPPRAGSALAVDQTALALAHARSAPGQVLTLRERTSGEAGALTTWSALEQRVRDGNNPSDVVVALSVAELTSRLDVVVETGAPPDALALLPWFEQVRRVSTPLGVEDGKVLAALVLTPLLAPPDDPRRTVLGVWVAHQLGYRWMQSADGQPERTLLIGAGDPRPIAVWRQPSEGERRLVEAPCAGDEEIRDLTVRLAQPLESHVVVLGFSPCQATAQHALMRALWSALPSDRVPTSLAIVRAASRDDDWGGTAQVGRWGHSDAWGDRVENALRAEGIPVERAPFDLATRDIIARAVGGQPAVVNVVADRQAQALASLDAVRVATTMFPQATVEAGTVIDVARRLVRQLSPDGTIAPAAAVRTPESFAALVRAAVTDQSVTARIQLEQACASSRCRLAIVRAAQRTLLMIAGRWRGDYLVAVEPLALAELTAPHPPIYADQFDGCTGALQTSGACIFKVP